MTLDHVTIQLNVRDLQASSTYYRKLGFLRHDGNDENWLILRQGHITIGLYEDLLEGPVSLQFQGANPRGFLTSLGIDHDVSPDGTSSRDPDGNTLHFMLP